MKILALDIATNTGWAIGDDRAKTPEFGSIRFASRGASYAAVCASALTWSSENFRIWRPDRIIYEEPLQFRGGRSREGNNEIAHGLVGIVVAVAYLLGIHDIRKATPKDIRQHFIAENPKREIAKRKTMAQCRTLGWNVTDDNQGDACALWSYGCGLQHFEAALRPTPLFGAGQ